MLYTYSEKDFMDIIYFSMDEFLDIVMADYAKSHDKIRVYIMNRNFSSLWQQ